MEKVWITILACFIVITSFVIGMVSLDYYNKSNVKKICGDIKIEDITENAESSFIKKIPDCKKVNIKSEDRLEKELCNKETEKFELQDEENISYDGDNDDNWNVELGVYRGLTYYSQLDNRWKNNLYTVIGDNTQTIGRSGCGPTCAAMIVSSIKGHITPDKMADLFIKGGFRSRNNGTYWSAYRKIADEFDIGYEETASFSRALELLKNNNYIIASCGNGLFTTGGHYIVIVGIEGNTLKIYDPYLYNGKFNISTRRGKVIVEGNTIYCSVENFKKYSNYKNFFCYQNIERTKEFDVGHKVIVNIPVGIAFKTRKKALVDDGSSQFWVEKSTITVNNRVNGIVTICYKRGEDYMVQLFYDQFWCKAKDIITVVN